MSLYDIVKRASIEVDEMSMQKTRTRQAVLGSAMAELGECAEEVQIEERFCYKKAGQDGIVGEAIDTILCLLDLIHVDNPNLTEDDINTIAQLKADKWVSKACKKRV